MHEIYRKEPAVDEYEIRASALIKLHDAISWHKWVVLISSVPGILLTSATVDWVEAYAQSVLSKTEYRRLSSDVRRIANILRRCIVEGPDAVLGPLLEQPRGGDHFVAGLLEAAEAGLSRDSDLLTLKQSIQFYDAALAHPAMDLAPIGVRRHTEFNAAVLRQRAAEWTASESLLAEVDTLVKCGLNACMPGSYFYPGYLHLKATNLQTGDRWKNVHTHESEAEELLQSVFNAYPDGSLRRAAVVDAIGLIQFGRYLREGEVTDLAAAIANFREALYAEGVFRTGAAANLSDSLLRMHRHDGNDEHLVEAMTVAESLIRDTPADARQRPSRLALLADILRHRYERSSDQAYLSHAIELAYEALESADKSNYEGRRRAAVSLSFILLDAWDRFGDPSHALKAVEMARHAINLADAYSGWGAEEASALGVALKAVNEATGDRTLAEAINWLRASADRTPDTDIRKPGRLANLSYALQALYLAEGTLVAIDEALAVSNTAIQLARDDDGDRAIYLFAHANAHHSRYEVYGERQNLAGTLIYYSKALDSLPDSAEETPMLYANLASGLLDRHALGEYAEDLDTAIEYLETALARASSGSRDRQRILVHLVSALLARHDRDGNGNDVDKAVGLARQSVTTNSGGIDLIASGQIALGHSLGVSAETHRRPAERAEAYAVLRDCSMNTMNIFPTAALTAASAWAAIAVNAGDDREAATAYRDVLIAERRVYQSQLTRYDQQIRLRATRALFTEAAFAFARVGDFKEAILAVENGRARLITERLGRSRADFNAVANAGRSDLAEALVNAINRVNALEAAASDAPTLTPMSSPQRRSLIEVEDLAAARSDIDRILRQIRALPDLAEFLIDTNWEHVAAASESTPLLYLLAGNDGGLALIVNAGMIRQLPPDRLPSLTETAVMDRVVALLQAREEDFPAWLDLLDETLNWAWDSVVSSVLDITSGTETLNIIPCGLLALLPLHAAWTINADGTRFFASDRVVWRYQPNARCMLDAKKTLKMEQAALGKDPPTVLVVHSPTHSDLASPISAGQDHVILRQQMNVVELAGEEATSERVIDALHTADVVHFACHAEARLGDAESSAFLLAGHDRLTVGRLLRVPTGQQRLAVLAACETGVPDGIIPDETVTLGTSLLVNGASGVLASLWKVSDRATNLLIDKFYALWLANDDGRNEDPARALRDAQRWLRTLPGQRSNFAHPSLWAGFIFMGIT